MGFLNFKGGRESNTEHSQNYKELIKDYFRSKGYTPFRDSIVEGCLTDIILKNIELDGQIETHVEVKWETFTVFSNKKILREFWEYMYLWLKTTKEERFFFWIFARKISNLERHKKIFEKYEGVELKRLRDLIVDVLIDSEKDFFNNIPDEDLLGFLNSTTLVQADIMDLMMKIKGWTGEFPDPDDAFKKYKNLKDTHVVIEKNENLTVNVVELRDFNTVWIADAKNIYEDEIRERCRFPPPYCLYNGKLISLYPFDKENPLAQIIELKTIRNVPVSEMLTDDNDRRVLLWLLNRTMNRMCQLRGLYRVGKENVYYFPNRDRKEILLKRWKNNTNPGKRISQYYRFTGLGACYFHPGIQIGSTFLNGRFYFYFLPKKVFTTDGIICMESRQVKRFEPHFRNPSFSRNDNLLMELKFWYDILFLSEDILSEGLFRSDSNNEKNNHARLIKHLLMPCGYENLQIDRKPEEKNKKKPGSTRKKTKKAPSKKKKSKSKGTQGKLLDFVPKNG